MIHRLLQRLRLVVRSGRNRIAVAVPAMGVMPGRSLMASLRSALAGLRQRLSRLWARLRGGGNVLNLPGVRNFAAWFTRQADHVQVAMITLLCAMALLLGVAAGRMGLAPPRVQEARAEAQPTDLAGILYALMDGQPGSPGLGCQSFETQVVCQRRLEAAGEKYEDDFADYVHRLQGEQKLAVWSREGGAFPKYDSGTGELAFDFALEGKAQGKLKPTVTPSPLQKKVTELLAKLSSDQGQTGIYTPLRVIMKMPEGVSPGIWPDQGDVQTKPKTFAHPCLRAPDWKAVVRVPPDTARTWEERAKADGWRLEMVFRLEQWEDALRRGWDEDTRLDADDLLPEQRMDLWVDEVRLVIGDLVVQRWR